MIFIITILLLAADFYYLKNIAGRRLVGHRGTVDGYGIYRGVHDTSSMVTTMLTCPEWLDLATELTADTDRLRLSRSTDSPPAEIDGTRAVRAAPPWPAGHSASFSPDGSRYQATVAPFTTSTFNSSAVNSKAVTE